MLEDNMGSKPNTYSLAFARILPYNDFWTRRYRNEANANTKVFSFINYELFSHM